MAKETLTETAEVTEVAETAPTQYRAVTMRVPEDIFVAVESYRWDALIDKRADAFLELLVKGLTTLKAK